MIITKISSEVKVDDRPLIGPETGGNIFQTGERYPKQL